MSELSPATETALHRVVAARQSEGRVPGIAAGVVRDGRLAWTGGVGAADLAEPGRRPDEDTQFLIASNTKTFTAVLVMQLRDEGRLDLDDPLERHIPESTHGGVTIRQLLAHVSGMQREPVGDVWETLTYPDRVALVAGWNEAERILRPHYRWHYSNLCYSMLGEVVARLDGREWVDSLRARILEPLGMNRTTLGLVPPCARGYYVPPFSDVPVVEPVLDIDAMAAAGGLASTVADLATWTSFVADPVAEVLSPDTVDEMCQPQIMADLETWQAAWGLGFMLQRSGDRVWVGHTGGMPGHITGVFTQRKAKAAAIVLMNSSGTVDPAAFAIELGGLSLDRDPSEPEAWTAGTGVPPELAGVLGIWYSEGQPYVFSVRAGRLEARAANAPAQLPPSVFVPEGEDRYRTQSGRETGELLRITRAADGTVAKMNWATYLVTREPLAFGEWLRADGAGT
ncbi:MAG TPA: serine hydrolase domain-containing protein [Nocardioidaceae bacterium]|nr:serine hydrolase domain-containing protein [Nocardioidaceae bacterium]